MHAAARDPSDAWWKNIYIPTNKWIDDHPLFWEYKPCFDLAHVASQNLEMRIKSANQVTHSLSVGFTIGISCQEYRLFVVSIGFRINNLCKGVFQSYRGFEVKQPLLHSVHGWNHVGTSVPGCYHCYQRALHPVWNAMRILKIPHQTQTWNIFIPAVLSNGFPGRVAHWINHKASVDLCCPSGRAWVVKVSEQWVFGAVPVPAGGCCWFHAMSCGWSSLKTTLWNTDEYGWIWQEHANICKLSNKWRCWRKLGRLTAIHTILHPDVSHPWFSIPSVEES